VLLELYQVTGVVVLEVQVVEQDAQQIHPV
jgi:hypothetical protein